MNENKSFWVWFIRGIITPLKDLYGWVHKHWYVVLIYSGPWLTVVSLLNAWMNYHPTWVSGDYLAGIEGYFVDPKIMPWMIFWPVVGVGMFMTGLYGYWRKEVSK